MNSVVARRAKGSPEGGSTGGSPRTPAPHAAPAGPEGDALLPPSTNSTTSFALQAALEASERGGSKRTGSPGAAGASGGGGRGGWLRWTAWTLLAAVGLLLVLSWADRLDYSHQNFVKVEGTQFSLDCRPFYIAGFNVDNIAQAPLPQVARKLTSTGGGKQMVRTVFQQAAAAGLNVMRTFAHTTDPAYPLQTEPGEYDETVFRGLDLVIAEAQRAGLRVILSFVDNWKYYGGVDQFVDWSPSVPARDPKFPPANKLGDASVEDYSPERLAYENMRKVHFYQDDGCRKMYKEHLRTVLDRRNYYTGRLYREDPTIMAFNLINEPRCSAYETPDCPAIFQRWVDDMAAHFKSIDHKHLLTVGEEGFWGERDAMRPVNPGAAGGSDWAAKAGQDFVPNHKLPNIDFAAVHLWPDNWNTHNHSFHREWMDKHVEDCSLLLKKPCVVEEFGKVLGRGKAPPAKAVADKRDPVFANVYGAVEGGIGRGKAMGGSLYWRWGLNIYANDLPGPYGVLPEHSTFQLIAQHAQRVKAHMNTQLPRHECQSECWVPAPSAFGLVRRCENRPSVCAAHRMHRQYEKALVETEGGGGGSQLVSYGQEVFASQAECCRPGLGGFAKGCSTTWF